MGYCLRGVAPTADAKPGTCCAVAGAANPLITRLLLERGAVPGDHDLYLAGSADDNHECLRLLLFHAADVAQLACQDADRAKVERLLAADPGPAAMATKLTTTTDTSITAATPRA